MKHEIERNGLVEGRPPTCLWTAFQVDESPGIVVCVALRGQAEELDRRLEQRGIRLPFATCNVTSGAGRKLELGVIVIGDWPFEEAKRITEQISGQQSDTTRTWARRIAELKKEQPDALAKPTDSLPDAIVHELAKMFVNECCAALGLDPT